MFRPCFVHGLYSLFHSNLAIFLKRQVNNSCVLPAMTCGAETGTLAKQAQNKLAGAQTKMERSMLNITYKDRKTNIWVRERTKVIYTIILHKSVCQCSQTAGRNSCAIVSGDVSNCPYRLTVHHVTSSRLSSANNFVYAKNIH